MKNMVDDFVIWTLVLLSALGWTVHKLIVSQKKWEFDQKVKRTLRLLRLPYDSSASAHTNIIQAQAWLDMVHQHKTMFHTWMGCSSELLSLQNVISCDLQEDKRTHKELAAAYPVWSNILLGQTPASHTYESENDLDYSKMFVSLRPASLRSFVLWRCDGLQEAASAVRSNSSILFSAIREDVCTLLSQVWQDTAPRKKNGLRLVALRTFQRQSWCCSNNKTSSLQRQDCCRGGKL